jgi:hypothetical protein
MLRTKKDVDKHVQELLKKVNNENEVTSHFSPLMVVYADGDFMNCSAFCNSRTDSCFIFVYL